MYKGPMKKCRPPRRKATLALLNAVLIPLLAVPGTASPFQSSSKERALALVQEAIRHIGGETALRSLKSVQFDAIGHTHLIEQSERPEGPWIADYQEKSELVDLENNRFVRTVRHRNFQSPQWSRDLETVVGNGVAAARFGERTAPGSAMEVAEAEERLALSPERVLLTALAASDLHTEGDVALQSVSQHVVVFSWGNGKVRLFLNSASALPTAVEVVRAYPTSVFFHLWGDVSTRTYWTLWTLEAGGVRYPRQWNLERNGVEQQEWTLTSIELNAPVEASRFAIPEETQKAYREGVVQVDDWPLGRPDQPASEIAPGVIQIPGRWNVALIRQTDGVVVVEGPISSGSRPESWRKRSAASRESPSRRSSPPPTPGRISGACASMPRCTCPFMPSISTSPSWSASLRLPTVPIRIGWNACRPKSGA